MKAKRFGWMFFSILLSASNYVNAEVTNSQHIKTCYFARVSKAISQSIRSGGQASGLELFGGQGIAGFGEVKEGLSKAC